MRPRSRELFSLYFASKVYINALQMPSDLEAALRKAMQEVATKDGEGRLLKKYNRADAWDATKQAMASRCMKVEGYVDPKTHFVLC